MAVDRRTLIFFDASCLVAAAHRPTGGSGYVLMLCRRELLRAAVSPLVLGEAESNIRTKFPPMTLASFERQLSGTTFVLASLPLADDLARYTNPVNAKDAHVIAAAMSVNARYLLTLDQAFERELRRADFPVQGMSPGKFIRNVLPNHPEAVDLRE